MIFYDGQFEGDIIFCHLKVVVFIVIYVVLEIK